MNTTKKSDRMDDLPILTEVVVPSPIGLKMSANAPHPSLSAPTVIPDETPFSAPNQKYAPDVAYEEEPVEELAASLSVVEIRETLVAALQKRFAIEIPTLVEAALQNALPAITQDIREGLEENAKLALKDLIASLHEKSPPLKR